MCVGSFYRCFSISSSSRKYYFLFLFPPCNDPTRPFAVAPTHDVFPTAVSEWRCHTRAALCTARTRGSPGTAAHSRPDNIGPTHGPKFPIDGCSRSSSLGFDGSIMSALSSSETFPKYSLVRCIFLPFGSLSGIRLHAKFGRPAMAVEGYHVS